MDLKWTTKEPSDFQTYKKLFSSLLFSRLLATIGGPFDSNEGLLTMVWAVRFLPSCIVDGQSAIMLVPSGIFPVQHNSVEGGTESSTERRRKTRGISFYSWYIYEQQNDQNWKPNKNLDSNKNQHAKEQNPFTEINNNHRTKVCNPIFRVILVGVSREHIRRWGRRRRHTQTEWKNMHRNTEHLINVYSTWRLTSQLNISSARFQEHVFKRRRLLFGMSQWKSVANFECGTYQQCVQTIFD